MVEEVHFNEKYKIKVFKLTKNNFNSNTYILSFIHSNQCIIIDPSEWTSTFLIDWLKTHNKIIKYCFITHEHFDHHAGYELLKNVNDFKTLCSLITIEGMANSKKNLSYFYNLDIKSHVINHINETEENYINIVSTPGHSKGSICIFIDDMLFSGDTIIAKEYLTTKLPGGNKLELKKSISLVQKKIIDNKFSSDVLVFPGHGNKFFLKDIKVE
ncbi:MBL fold metallo-hydrolase [Aureivirga marina]|uniref:MBL fold metallo-hydrolase n=1 Tax=Aureivirga marina TaxID=1182451 RepID=UPI0018CA1580|nr:MBL fold metallo-hydrolase [Aureivirga marina]